MNRKISFSNVADFGFLMIVFVLFIFFNNRSLNENEKAYQKSLQKNQNIDKEILSEEYEIYASVIKSEVGDGSIVIEEKTSILSFSDLLKYVNESGLQDNNKNYPADEDTINNFREANNYNFNLKNNFSVKNKILFYTEKQQDRIFERAYKSNDKIEPHELFKKEFNHSTSYTFSRVGFNKDKTKALLFISTWCGSLCGEGSFVYLEKDKQNWVIKRKNTVVVA